MAYFLRILLIFMVSGLLITSLSPYHPVLFGHISVAIITFLMLLFIQAFVMFYFIGVNRLMNNIEVLLTTGGQDLKELFGDIPQEEIPEDLEPYKKKIQQYNYKSKMAKRKTIPWTMMMITLGMMTFMLGAAYDTGMVSREIHKGLAIGLWASVIIGVTHQWILLGQSYHWLRQIKGLFSLSNFRM